MNKIIFIDDSAEKLISFIELLEFNGFCVDVVKDIDNAISLLQKNNDYQLVILDMIMPYNANRIPNDDEEFKGFRTGLFLLDKIKQIIPNVPIVIFSVLRDSEIEKEAIRRGAVRYIHKSSIIFKDFLNIIKNVISERI